MTLYAIRDSRNGKYLGGLFYRYNKSFKDAKLFTLPKLRKHLMKSEYNNWDRYEIIECEVEPVQAYSVKDLF